jgi:hypothetical protein
MKWISCLAVALAVAACQSSRDDRSNEAPAPSDPVYKRDIEKVCDVVALSGAAGMADNDRMFTIANWLSANLESPQTRTYLARIQPLTGNAKAEALEAEARRVGLPGCALAAEWRRPASAPAP